MEELSKKIAEDCLAVRIRLLDRYVTRLYNDALRPYGLKISQLNILTLVDLNQQVGPGEICQRLHLEKSTVSRNIERMRKRGWINVVMTPNRTQIITVTKAGKELILEAGPAWEKVQERVSVFLGDSGSWAVRSLADIVWTSEEE